MGETSRILTKQQQENPLPRRVTWDRAGQGRRKQKDIGLQRRREAKPDTIMAVPLVWDSGVG